MLPVAALAPFVMLATTVAADPNAIPNSPVSLPITKQINPAGTFHPSQRDQKRWMNLLNGGQRSTSETTDVPLTDSVISYTVNVGVGDPAIFCESCQFLPGIVFYMSILDNLIIDTGSANTWVGANKPYKKTKTSVETDDFVVSIVSRGSWLSSN
jgi:hypothetical protein